MISILTEDCDSVRKNVLPSLASGSRKVTEVAVDVLSGNLQQFLRNFEVALDSTDLSTSRFQLDQIELNLVVNAEGSIELVGKVSSGVVASVKVTLKRKEP